jgi:hypothetical protein
MNESWLWTEDNILDLIRNKVRESINLDYKSCDALSKTDAKRKDISKDVSAFANSAGGTIVYGVTEDRSTHEPKNIDIGYDLNDISDEWIEQVINSNVQRRIDGIKINTVYLNKTHPGKVLYVVYIPESKLAPHMAADHRFYKRFNFESVPMEEYEIRYLANREHYPSNEVVRAWRDAIINPLLSKLLREQQYLVKRKWTWELYRTKLSELSYISDRASYSGLQEEFSELYPEIQGAMDKHDEAVTNVRTKCEKFFQEIVESQYLLDLYLETTSAESLQKLRSEFPTKLERYQTDEDLLTELFGRSSPREDHLRLLAQYIVNGTDELPNNYTTYPFWNTYNEKFLLMTNYPPISVYSNDADKARDELIHSVEFLISLLKKTRSELAHQHGIPVEEPAKGGWL